MKTVFIGMFTILALLLAPIVQADAELVKNSGCRNCHNIDTKLVGPALKEIAAKYTVRRGATDYLAGKIKNGSIGIWGPIPMPPNPMVSDENAKVLANYILSLNNTEAEISTQTLIDTETLLNWAENTYAELFSDHQITQNIEPWLFRHYPQTGIYAGVNTSDLNVYVLGGPWGNNPVFIDSLSNLLVLIANSNDDSGNNNNRTATCNTTNAPAGLLYTQNGNIVNVTTNGECIPLPENTNLCPLPPQPSATSTSLLTTFTQTSRSVTKGIESNGRLVRESLPTSEMLRTKYCTINASEEAIDLIVHADFCYDMTAEFLGRSFSSITINPPVTFATKGVFEHKRINSDSSCFDYEATIITDAATGEVWKRQEDGSYIKVSN